MGCTSSAPPQLPTSATDESSGRVERTEVTEQLENSEELQVLPSCDSVLDRRHLDNNQTTAMDSQPLENKPTENIFIQNSKEENESEQKLSTLEESVEQAVELCIENKQDDSHAEEPVQIRGDGDVEERSHDVTLDTAGVKEEHDTDGINDNIGNKDLTEDHVIEAENTEQRDSVEEADTAESKELAESVEMDSESESNSSRMTRWEALADIAAELPPSLTVDPLTGQIYTLTK